MTKARRKKIDWEQVEKDFRSGQLSIRAMAEKHKTSESTIRCRAKSRGWERDLSGAVKVQTKAQLSRSFSRSKNTASECAEKTEAQIINEAVATNISVVSGHIKSIGTLRRVTDQFSEILSNQVSSGKVTIDMGGGVTAVIDVPLDYVGKGLTAATGALERLIKLERQAYSLDSEGESNDLELESLLTDMESKLG